MSRFSPDTWIDAVGLPFAMLQMSTGHYVEVIAPDARAATLSLATGGLVLVGCWRLWRRLPAGSPDNTLPPMPVAVEFNRRAAWALLTATWGALIMWIATTANGRYGQLALALAPLATLAALLLMRGGSRLIWGCMIGLLVVQAIFLKESDPQDGWSRWARERWRSANVSTYPAALTGPWQKLANSKSLVVVTTNSQTAMSLLPEVFGSRARYISLAHSHFSASDSLERRQVADLLNRADSVVSVIVIPSGTTAGKASVKPDRPIPLGDRQRLREFGLDVSDLQRCELLPPRMAAILQLCPLSKVKPETISYQAGVPPNTPQVLFALQRKCPRIFGEARPFYVNSSGNLAVSVGDAKYHITIDRDMNVSVQQWASISPRKILDRYRLMQLDGLSCAQIIGAGRQHWAGE